MAATLQRKYPGGIIFVTITKIITKETVPRNDFVIISARETSGEVWETSGEPLDCYSVPQ